MRKFMPRTQPHLRTHPQSATAATAATARPQVGPETFLLGMMRSKQNNRYSSPPDAALVLVFSVPFGLHLCRREVGANSLDGSLWMVV